MTASELNEAFRLVQAQFGELTRTDLDHLTHVRGIALEAKYVGHGCLCPRKRVSIETFIRNVQYYDFRTYTTVVCDYLHARPQVVHKNVLVCLRATHGAEAFNKIEPGTCFAVPSGKVDCPALAMFLLARLTPKEEIFRLSIGCDKVHYVRKSNELDSPRFLVSTSPRPENLTLVRLEPNVRRVAAYCSCSTTCIQTRSDGYL